MAGIFPNPPFGYSLGLSPFAVIGLEFSGTNYQFLLSEASPSNVNIYIYKSINAGTTWTEVTHFSPTPVPPNPGANPSYTVCQDGNKAYLMYVDCTGTGVANQAGPLFMRVFDLTTESLGIEQNMGFQVYKTNAGFRANINLVRRGTADMLLVYSSAPVDSGGIYAKIGVVGFNGAGMVGGGTEMPGQLPLQSYKQTAAGVDDSGVLQVIASSSIGGLFHFGMTSLGTFGAGQLVVAGTGPSNYTSRLVFYPGSIGFLTSANFGDTIVMWHANSGTLGSVWDSHVIPSTSPVVEKPNVSEVLPFALGYLAGRLQAAWTRSGVASTWRWQDGQGVVMNSSTLTSNLNGWSAAVPLISTPSAPANLWAASEVTLYNSSTIGLAGWVGFVGTVLPDPPGGLNLMAESFDFSSCPTIILGWV